MTFKKGKGKIHILTYRKPKFQVTKNPHETSKKKILFSTVCRKKRSFFSEV